MGCFDTTPHENLENCPNEDILAGLATKMYYVPTAFVQSFTKPTGTDFEGKIKIPTGGIVLESGKSWKFIDILIDENELKSMLTGNTGNKKSKGEADFYIPGFKAKGLGFIDSYKNTPCLYAFKDAEGNFWIMGTKDIGAYIESAEGTTGKKVEDNSGISAKVTSNNKLFLYEGEITLEAAP